MLMATGEGKEAEEEEVEGRMVEEERNPGGIFTKIHNVTERRAASSLVQMDGGEEKEDRKKGRRVEGNAGELSTKTQNRKQQRGQVWTTERQQRGRTGGGCTVSRSHC